MFLAHFPGLVRQFPGLGCCPLARAPQHRHSRRLHCAEWDDSFLAKLQFEEFLEDLAGACKAQPVLQRIPLLQWLTTWEADHDSSAVACPRIETLDPLGKEVGKVPGPSPMGKLEWELELKRRVDDKSMLGRDTLVTLRAKEALGGAAPT